MTDHLMKRCINIIAAALIAAVICMCAQSCAIVNKKASEYAYGDECSHCHGKRLEGNRNVRRQCGGCHDLSPLPVEKIESAKIRETVLSEPHVHKTRNMFSNTPSCFLCHRQDDL